ncbi:hypothetical protein TCAL_09469 [Tigriopus californicus]|uniref:Uncharacterized protein n=2 Tax=Tigriopus californicus TaxID=6832 RepID=A0A553PM38_TIGCA|nr:hypothetical protein TCAL_09469 [Tigriopus californicus]|eukprot:TCALIF_09469-PA protein Name:"Protein of unknown function" AED:0.00 eAED:0.00 QI:118/1/1/1/0.5/0.33/3/438/204
MTNGRIMALPTDTPIPNINRISAHEQGDPTSNRAQLVAPPNENQIIGSHRIPCDECRKDCQDILALKDQCLKLRLDLANTRRRREHMEKETARKMSDLKSEHVKAIHAMKSTVLGPEDQGDVLKKDFKRLLVDHETVAREICHENQRLRDEIAKLIIHIDVKSVEADDECLKVAKLLNRLKDTKRGMKNIHGDDDESYIEIIIP